MPEIVWRTEKRKIKDLMPYENNPRLLTNTEYEKLKKSIYKFDLAEIPAINTDNTILAGHMRLKILEEKQGPEYEIDVRVPNRKLNDKESAEYLIRSNKNTGIWDQDMLANNFDMPDLLEWGFEKFEFGDFGDFGDFDIDEDKSPIEDDDEGLDNGILTLEFTQHDYIKVLEKLDLIRSGTESNEQIFFKLLANFKS